MLHFSLSSSYMIKLFRTYCCNIQAHFSSSIYRSLIISLGIPILLKICFFNKSFVLFGRYRVYLLMSHVIISILDAKSSAYPGNSFSKCSPISSIIVSRAILFDLVYRIVLILFANCSNCALSSILLSRYLTAIFF